MKFNRKWLIFHVNILTIVHVCSAEIKLIQAVFRHADRNPQSGKLVDMYYPSDPDKYEDWEPDGRLELNNMGKLTAYNLGKFFRKDYNDFFGPKYKNDIVYFQSADMMRSINTAQLLAAGLFPPEPSQIWNPDLLWTPVPIRVTHLLEDYLFYSALMCENYKIDKLESEAEVQRLLSVLSDMRGFRNYLNLHTGVNHTRSFQGWMLYHQFAAKTSVGRELESWAREIFPEGKLKDISAVEYILQTYTMRMKRLMGGVWLKKFFNASEKIVNNEKTQKGFFYAGNEVHVAGILNTLGVYEPHVPGYASAVIFELHEVEGEFYVKIIYKDGETPVDLQIPGCGVFCLLSTFKYLLKNVTLENFEEDCGKITDFWMTSL
ncbi:venom acid phosphatase Acph-1 [Diachasma alloeum]|uniref:venom acid phosphatase Acph-1 n=1 Tax=Diachasma alloeum TaxID=454923 RepID=UPI00073810DB|nr:venom acid phosphatase Acph-1 [Diachasma alloeum]